MIEILGSEKDKLGNDIEIKQVDHLAYSPVFSFFLRQQADLIDEGLLYPTTNWDDYNCGAIYAEFDNKIVGLIVYDTVKDPNALRVIFSFVDKSVRQRNIFTLLHKYLIDFGKKNNYSQITDHIHIKNELGLVALKTVGMNPNFYFMVKKLK
jgi:hypothetical protein